MKLEIPERYIAERQKSLEEITEILEKLGINLFDEYGQYRSIFDIIEEISIKWQEIKKENKNE